MIGDFSTKNSVELEKRFSVVSVGIEKGIIKGVFKASFFIACFPVGSGKKKYMSRGNNFYFKVPFNG